MSTPKSTNPVIDETGRFASVNQPIELVWFLAGKLGDGSKTIPTRFCRIPKGRSVLFPVINCEANPLEYPDLINESDLIEKVDRDENTIILKECFMDSTPIPPQRVKSDPIVFQLRIHEDNACGVSGGGTIRATADGFWVFLKPLTSGRHIITFRGSCENGRLYSGAYYEIQVE